MLRPREQRGDSAGMLLPALSPYEREVLAEHLDHQARRDGSVHLQAGAERCTFVWRDGVQPCTGCGSARGARTHAGWCARCAIERLAPDTVWCRG